MLCRPAECPSYMLYGLCASEFPLVQGNPRTNEPLCTPDDQVMA